MGHPEIHFPLVPRYFVYQSIGKKKNKTEVTYKITLHLCYLSEVVGVSSF